MLLLIMDVCQAFVLIEAPAAVVCCKVFFQEGYFKF